MSDKEALKRVAEKLRRAGASLPAPELTGTIEGSVVTGLCIALALVETEIEALADSMREVQRLGQDIEQERNFCPRCGKRTKDMTHIHTCTPPSTEGG